MRLESTSSLDRDTLATGYSDASLTPSSAPGSERTLVLASVEQTGRLQSPVTDHARLSTPIPKELRVDQHCSSRPRFRSVIARGTSGEPRTYRLASPLAQRVAYRRLALTILGLDVGHLAAELRGARLNLAHAA
jgi:transglutaminase-like putative cysteine protease